MSGEKKATGGKKRFRGGMRALSTQIPAIARRAFARRGFYEATIVTEWPAIVGAALAADTIPERLSFPPGSRTGGTLKVRVNGAFATELQHLEPLVLEKINRHFGYAAVARLAMVHGPVERPPAPPREDPEPVPVEEETRLATRLSDIGDESLRDALMDLGRAVKSRDQKSGS